MRAFMILLLAVATSWGAEGNAAFDAGDYPGAIRQAEQSVQAAPSAEGYFNLGLALEKKGDATDAALNYERALLLDPGLSPARNALAKLAASRGIPLPPHQWFDEVRTFVHPDTLVWIGFFFVWGGAFGLLFATQARRRIGIRALSVLALLGGAAALITGWVADARMVSALPAMVNAGDSAEVLSAPANNASAIIALPPGTPVNVLSPRGVWAYVDVNGGAKGWIPTSRLTPLVPGESL